MDFEETMRAQIAARPRVKFLCERDWLFGPHVYVIGFLWDRNFEAMPGEMSYRRRFLLRLTFRLSLDRQ